MNQLNQNKGDNNYMNRITKNAIKRLVWLLPLLWFECTAIGMAIVVLLGGQSTEHNYIFKTLGTITMYWYLGLIVIFGSKWVFAKIIKPGRKRAITNIAIHNKPLSEIEITKAYRNNSSKKLHLNIKKEGFNRILYAGCKEDYREIKSYWINRLVNNFIMPTNPDKDPKYLIHCLKYRGQLDNKQINFKKFDSIIFSNGYSKNRRQFEIELKKIEIASGKEEWGAEPNKEYFVLHLGNILWANVKEALPV